VRPKVGERERLIGDLVGAVPGGFDQSDAGQGSQQGGRAPRADGAVSGQDRWVRGPVDEPREHPEPLGDRDRLRSSQSVMDEGESILAAVRDQRRQFATSMRPFFSASSDPRRMS
jgi:hypothetical protein